MDGTATIEPAAPNPLSSLGYMPEEQACKLMNMRPRTARQMRQEGRGPAYMKIGGSIFYRLTAIEAYLKSLEVDPGARRPKARRA